MRWGHEYDEGMLADTFRADRYGELTRYRAPYREGGRAHWSANR